MTISIALLVLALICIAGLVVFLTVKNNPDVKTLGLHVFSCALLTIMWVVFVGGSFRIH